MRTPGLIRITRPLNSVVAGFAAVLAFLLATGTVTFASLILIPIVVLITAAGNVVNDLFDIGIDRINRPDRPLPSGEITAGTARSFATLLFLPGSYCCIFTNSLCFAIAVFNSAVLILYASYFKKTMVVGNAAVSYLSASIFLFGGAFAGIDGLLANLPIFRDHISRDDGTGSDQRCRRCRRRRSGRSKDASDRTRYSKILPHRDCFCAAGNWSEYPAVLTMGRTVLVGIAIADIVILAGVIRPFRCHTSTCVRNSCATTYIKVGMFVALGVFTFSALVF